MAAEEQQLHRGEISELRRWPLLLLSLGLLLLEGGPRTAIGSFSGTFATAFNTTQSTTAIVFGVLNSSSMIAGPLAAFFYQLFGARITIVAGSFLAGIGYFLIAITNNIYQVVALALPTGIGCCFIRTATVSAQCDFFVRYRNAAMGVIFIGPGVGAFIFTHFYAFITEKFSWRITWYFVGAFFILAALAGLAFRRHISSHPSRVPKHRGASLLCGVSVFCMPAYVFHVAAVFFASGAVFIYFSFIVAFMEFRGLTRDESRWAFSLQAIASLIGRLLATVVVHQKFTNMSLFILFCYSFAQTFIFSALICSNQFQFVVQNVGSGLGAGMFAVGMAPFLVDLVGPEQFPAALGFTNLANGIGGLAMNKLAGIIAHEDSLDSVFWLAYVVGSSSIVCSVIAAWICSTRKTVLLEANEKQHSEAAIDLSEAEPINSID